MKTTIPAPRDLNWCPCCGVSLVAFKLALNFMDEKNRAVTEEGPAVTVTPPFLNRIERSRRDRAEALRLRGEGMAPKDIREKMGITDSTLDNYLYNKRKYQEPATAFPALKLGRLERAAQGRIEARRLRDEGFTQPQIAAKMGVTKGQVTNFIYNSPGKNKKGGWGGHRTGSRRDTPLGAGKWFGRRGTPELEADVLKLRREGKGRSEIMGELGVSRSRVNRLFQKQGPI